MPSSADILSLNGLEGEAILSPKAFRDDNLGVTDPDNLCIISMDQQKGQKPGEQALMNSVSNPKSFVSHEDLSVISMQENVCGEEESVLNNCGILPNNCLPCLVVATSTAEKRKAQSSSPPNSAKKASLKLSFKRKSGEAHATSTQCERIFFMILCFFHRTISTFYMNRTILTTNIERKFSARCHYYPLLTIISMTKLIVEHLNFSLVFPSHFP